MTQTQFENGRLVWAALSAHPGSSIRDLMDLTGLCSASTTQALKLLFELGYATVEFGRARSWRAVVPLVAMSR